MNRTPEHFWSSLPLGPGVQLVSHDANGIAAFAKPAGVLSHPNSPRDEGRSLLRARYDENAECFEWSSDTGGAPLRLHLLNRLDSATSGLLLGASSESLAREIRALFQQRGVKKIYNALVFGVPAVAQQTWRDQLAVQKQGGRIRTAATGNIPSEAHMRVLRQRRGDVPLALIELEPKTGRSHQLRVQCAKRHLPIVGDATYGNFRANRDFAKATGLKRMFLHSLATAFDYNVAGRMHHFAATAPLPEEFASVL